MKLQKEGQEETKHVQSPRPPPPPPPTTTTTTKMQRGSSVGARKLFLVTSQNLIWGGVPEGVSESDPPPELDLGPPPPAAPVPPPSKCDVSTLTEPVLPHTLPPDATPVASTPQSDLPPLDATQIALPEAPASAPLRPIQAAAPLPLEELAADAAAEAAEAAKRAAVAAIISPSQLAEERVLGKLLKLARVIRQSCQSCQYIGHCAFMCLCLSRECRAYCWEGANRVDLVNSYAPWAIERCTRICASDGICCCLVPTHEVAAVAALMPVSETHP